MGKLARQNFQAGLDADARIARSVESLLFAALADRQLQNLENSNRIALSA